MPFILSSFGFRHSSLLSGLFRLVFHDLVHPPGVPAALERRLQPDADHPFDQFLAQEVGGKAEDVRVVVPATEFGSDTVVARRRPRTADLVGRDAHADARAADQYAALDAAVAD